MRRERFWQLILCASLIGSLVVLFGCDSAGAGGGGDDEGNGGDNPNTASDLAAGEETGFDVTFSPSGNKGIRTVTLTVGTGTHREDLTIELTGTYAEEFVADTSSTADGRPLLIGNQCGRCFFPGG